MTIVVDGIVFSLQRQGGISVYFRELLKDLAQGQKAACLTLETPLMQEVAGTTDRIEVVSRPGRTLGRCPCRSRGSPR